MNTIQPESEHEKHRSSDPVQGELRGRVRSARLAWTDPQSGERLTVDLQGSDGFLRSLEQRGFEPIGGALFNDKLNGKPRGLLESFRRVWGGRAQLARRRTPARN